jgi:hypothetical protein
MNLRISAIVIGAALILLGIAWPYLAKALPFLVNLPGNFAYKGKNFSFYFPLTLSIILSLVLTGVLYLISKLSH